MTVENMFGYPMINAMNETIGMFDTALTQSLPPVSQNRTRHHSGGSTGSQGSSGSSMSCISGSSMSCVSDKSLPCTPEELLAFHLSQTRSQRPTTTRRVDRTMSCPSERSAQGQKNVNTQRYKTEMCRPFEESGHCKYGEKCQFAHGNPELRNMSRHPKYKTDLCRTYHTVGFCPYGPRCHFIHNEDELKLGEITHLKHQQVLKQVAQQVAQQQQVFSRLALQQSTESTRHQMSMVPPMMAAPSQACPIPRPQTLDFSLLSLPNLALSMGSTMDSPPSSVTDSPPSLSPTSMTSDDVFSGIPTPPPGFSALPPMSAPPKIGVFHYPDVLPTSPAPSSLGVASPRDTSTGPMASLVAGLQMAALNAKPSMEDEVPSMFNAPPTPPPSSIDGSEDFPSNESSCSDVAKGCRLPIFSSLAY